MAGEKEGRRCPQCVYWNTDDLFGMCSRRKEANPDYVCVWFKAKEGKAC